MGANPTDGHHPVPRLTFDALNVSHNTTLLLCMPLLATITLQYPAPQHSSVLSDAVANFLFYNYGTSSSLPDIDPYYVATQALGPFIPVGSFQRRYTISLPIILGSPFSPRVASTTVRPSVSLVLSPGAEALSAEMDDVDRYTGYQPFWKQTEDITQSNVVCTYGHACDFPLELAGRHYGDGGSWDYDIMAVEMGGSSWGNEWSYIAWRISIVTGLNASYKSPVMSSIGKQSQQGASRVGVNGTYPLRVISAISGTVQGTPSVINITVPPENLDIGPVYMLWSDPQFASSSQCIFSPPRLFFVIMARCEGLHYGDHCEKVHRLAPSIVGGIVATVLVVLTTLFLSSGGPRRCATAIRVWLVAHVVVKGSGRLRPYHLDSYHQAPANMLLNGESAPTGSLRLLLPWMALKVPIGSRDRAIPTAFPLSPALPCLCLSIGLVFLFLLVTSYALDVVKIMAIALVLLASLKDDIESALSAVAASFPPYIQHFAMQMAGAFSSLLYYVKKLDVVTIMETRMGVSCVGSQIPVQVLFNLWMVSLLYLMYMSGLFQVTDPSRSP